MLNRLRRLVRAPGPTNGFGRFDLPLLITYSRSGTNWIRYIVEYLSGKPTPGHTRIHEGEDYAIDRAHEGYRIADKHPSIILVIRNYKESLIRHYVDEWKKLQTRGIDVVGFLEDESGRQPPAWFIRNIAAFDAFAGDKLLLYYEDLMTEPEVGIRQLAEFLALGGEPLDDLLQNLDEHKQRSVGMYRRNQESYTEGAADKLNYHSAQMLSVEEQRAFDDYYAERYPELFEKYLKRYRTADATG